jgi:predicted MFS family arabinose efflux permease
VLQGVFAGFSVFAMALASVSCPRDKVPVAIGRVQSAQLLSVAVGPAAGGYVASHWGIRAAFFVTAGMCALSLLGLILLFTEARPSASGAAADPHGPSDTRNRREARHPCTSLHSHHYGLLLKYKWIGTGV